MDILDQIIDGVKVRDTDLSRFRSSNEIVKWSKDTRRILVPKPNNFSSEEASWRAADAMSAFIEARRDELIAEGEARKMNMPTRNLDLVVYHIGRAAAEDVVLEGLTAGEVQGRLDRFSNATQMTNYEFNAYDALGQDECDRQGIETFYDMFGTEFAVAFYKRKNSLIAREDLVDLYRERDELNQRIQELEAQL